MTSERLREAHQARPFRAFTLHMSDGRSHRVKHPEALAVSPSGRTAVLFTPKDATHFIGLLLVTDIEIESRRRGGVDRNGSRGNGRHE